MCDMPLCSEDSNCYIHAQPALAVTWRGSLDICNEEGNGKFHGLEAHLSNKACYRAWEVAVKIPILLPVAVSPRCDIWPECFSESPPTSDNIAIYIFPEDESHEQGFNLLLDYVIHGDLALKSVVGDKELLMFTSLHLPEKHQKFQGKIYLWGVFKVNLASTSCQSDDYPLVQGACAEEKTNTTGTNKGSGGNRSTRVKPWCKCCVTSKTPPKKRNENILSGPKKNLDEKTSNKRAHDCEDVESEAILFSEKQKNKIVQKAKKGMQRDTKGVTFEFSFTPSIVSARKNGDKAKEIKTTSVPQGDLSWGLSTNYESSDQITDSSSFLDIVKAVNELEEPSGTDSELSSVMQVGQYTVKHDLGQTLEAIFEKYGDIAQGCPIQSISIRSRFLGELCEVLHQLKDVGFAGCRSHHLKSLLDAVTTAKNVGLDVSWLDQRYDHLKTTLMGIKNYRALQSDLAQTKAVVESRKKRLDLKKADLMKLQSEMRTLNGDLASLRVENEDLERKMTSTSLKAKRFIHKNLADGLL